MKLKRLGHVAICVQDVDKAVEFYQNLGMEIAWKDADWAYLKAGDDGLALLSPGYEQAGPHFGFVFSDRSEMETAYEQLKVQNIQVSPVHEHRDGTASFYGRDLDGNWFEYLYEPEAIVIEKGRRQLC
ncbi:MAG: VOC family protein [Okeania sp. SIO2G4]|uniref:VOC family protein n=1 Tax=unclassified Okeania TaxID=2634635 RepID=UPI0013BADACB|nr:MULTISPECIES: VOC family protein [unclassified Okeania]NEP08377.1 VOC family protein [Okeania sp. SIO4D6]NEP41981.1 VOC family protein [Okeania sp. SIO2H7]NEP73676.1 VOC family protein [Okeania sp. SIO2G5]NEP94374.1 VOC family protein [Okeania sp. SIO2F5]NEQ92236.1 VOC family protein [Okeania sp. SIO2G4]